MTEQGTLQDLLARVEALEAWKKETKEQLVGHFLARLETVEPGPSFYIFDAMDKAGFHYREFSLDSKEFETNQKEDSERGYKLSVRAYGAEFVAVISRRTWKGGGEWRYVEEWQEKT